MLKFHQINSFTNPIFKDLIIFVKQGVNKNFNDLFCVAGFKNNLVALQQNYEPNTIFVSTEIDIKTLNKIKSLTKKWKIRWIQLNKQLINRLNEIGNGNDFFVYYPKSHFSKQSFSLNNNSNYVLCDHIQNPENLGSIIRNGAAFNIDGLFIWESVNVYNPKVIRSSAGNIFNISLSIIENIEIFLNALKSKNIKLIGLQNILDAKPVNDLSNEEILGNVFVLGNEGHGIDKLLLKNLNASYKININSNVESLNVAATSAIIFYEINRKC
ncbi:TrmH family RNA methyltransferase [Mycoplasmoides pirum]|uniref:TrmH family RNA methyltransferase n=1 Tax=Mycoplasmoides pirum TaxID=2122 RepID=UPI0009DE6684|nr:RNA methyltransferase [Mycoplasmoides pirum]